MLFLSASTKGAPKYVRFHGFLKLKLIKHELWLRVKFVQEFNSVLLCSMLLSKYNEANSLGVNFQE